VVKVIPRHVVPGDDKLHGIAIALDGDGDRTPEDDADTNPLYGDTGYNYYSVEVVQRMGYDSYSPDSGVLIAMNTGAIGDRDQLPLNEARRGGGRGGRGGGAPRGGGPRSAGARDGDLRDGDSREGDSREGDSREGDPLDPGQGAARGRGSSRGALSGP
jgi:hypothetical protein